MATDYNKPEYDDSVEFTNDMDRLKVLSDEISLILNKPAFADWMRQTDDHFNTDCVTIHRWLKRDASQLGTSVDTFLNEIHRADTQ